MWRRKNSENAEKSCFRRGKITFCSPYVRTKQKFFEDCNAGTGGFCLLITAITLNIVNRGKWLGSPANIKGANKEAKIEVGRSMTVVHIFVIFCFALIHYA